MRELIRRGKDRPAYAQSEWGACKPPKKPTVFYLSRAMSIQAAEVLVTERLRGAKTGKALTLVEILAREAQEAPGRLSPQETEAAALHGRVLPAAFEEAMRLVVERDTLDDVREFGPLIPEGKRFLLHRQAAVKLAALTMPGLPTFLEDLPPREKGRELLPGNRRGVEEALRQVGMEMPPDPTRWRPEP